MSRESLLFRGNAQKHPGQLTRVLLLTKVGFPAFHGDPRYGFARSAHPDFAPMPALHLGFGRYLAVAYPFWLMTAGINRNQGINVIKWSIGYFDVPFRCAWCMIDVVGATSARADGAPPCHDQRCIHVAVGCIAGLTIIENVIMQFHSVYPAIIR